MSYKALGFESVFRGCSPRKNV